MSLLADDFFRIEVCDFWKYWQRKKGLFSSLSKWWDVGKKNTSRDLINALAIHLKSRLDEGFTSLKNHLVEHCSA